ncbi:cell surface protein [Methanosarcina barkeri MS]|uniref:Cell surface protein n=1 Tax=Methanosarcina barkeri MS TaxID=1434108 RepID=A0A0E3QX43_METBA|nr:PKD domain-containing protein [Methanosarcina barkeri]AKB55343.1 cell surface protein [Methanosarcina barkeri MS]
MRTSFKTLLLGMVFISLIFTCNKFPAFTGTSASLSDTKYANTRINTGFWDNLPGVIGVPDLDLAINGSELQNTTDDPIRVTINSLENLNSPVNSASLAEAPGNPMNNSSIKANETFNPTYRINLASNSNLTNNHTNLTNNHTNLTNNHTNLTNNHTNLTNNHTNLTNNTNHTNLTGSANLTNTFDLDRTVSLEEASGSTGSIVSGVGSGSGGDGGFGDSDNGEGILPKAFFSNSVTEGYVPLTVQFTDLSENAEEWNWDFGDGTISTEQNPVHTYTATGEYTATLEVSNVNGTNSTFSTIFALQPVLPIANFSSNVTSGTAPLTVQFTDLSENAEEWNWDFGDGAISTEQNPVHTYTATGKYTATLEVSNVNGTNSTFSTIFALQPVLPIANFSSNVTSGTAPLTVQFTDLSENAEEWNWDFGDGAISTEQNPVHTYTATGKYIVTFTAANVNSQSTKTGHISVNE